MLDQFLEAGFDALVCSDAGSSGTGGGQNTVESGQPGCRRRLPRARSRSPLPDSDDPFVTRPGRRCGTPTTGPGKEGGAPNFSLQTYSISRAFFELWDRLDGDYSYENFHAMAEGLADDPIVIPSIPIVACGPLPGGHSCASGAGIAVYEATNDPDGDGVGTWVQVRAFEAPSS